MTLPERADREKGESVDLAQKRTTSIKSTSRRQNREASGFHSLAPGTGPSVRVRSPSETAADANSQSRRRSQAPAHWSIAPDVAMSGPNA